MVSPNVRTCFLMSDACLGGKMTALICKPVAGKETEDKPYCAVCHY